MPQLVSANLKTMSLKNYSSLAEYNIIESIYSSILVDDEYSVSLGGINRSNVRVSMVDYPLATIANRLSASNYEIPAEFQGNYIEFVKAEIVGYKNITPSYNIAYESLEDTTKVQYITIDIYLPGTAYNSYKTNVRFLNNIKNWTLTNSSISGVVYIDLVLKNLDEVMLPDSDASYQYYSILNNRFGVSIEYGGSVLNPYLIDSADNYNIYVMQTTESNSYAVAETKYRSESLSLRFVKDIAFNVGANLNAITYNVILSNGDIEGNGMYINQLRIDADTEKTNVQTDEDSYTISPEDFYVDEISGKYVYVRYYENAVEAKYDFILESKIRDTSFYDVYVYNSRTCEYLYLENYSMASGKVTVVDSDLKVVRYSVATSLGMFAKITDNSIIRNLNINISEVYGTGINYVGVIAGQIISSKVYNVQVSGNKDIYVTGNNAVGGIAGRITGDSFIVNSTVSVSVEANYYGINNIFSSENFNVDSGTFNLYASNYTYVGGKIVNTEKPTSSNINVISYAGGIAGVIDVTAFEDSTDTNYSARVRECIVKGAITVSGEVAGGLTGYAGVHTVLSDSSVEIEEGAHIDASRIAGGVVAHNNQGLIQRNFIAHGQKTQYAIDGAIQEASSKAAIANGIYSVEHGVIDLFIGNPHYMGGIVGYNYLGSIEDSYGRVDVVNINAEYAGGIVGLNVGGQLRDIYTTADVYGFRTVGGVIGLQTMQITIENLDNDTVIAKNELLGVETVSNASISAGTFINNNMHIANQHELVNPEYTAVITIDNGVIDSVSSSSFTTNFTGIVAANLWTLSHLNVRRITSVGAVASNAHVGSLVGCEYYVVINGETKSAIYVGELSSRIHEEHIYTIESFTYDSINAAGGLVVLNSIGNFTVAQESFTLTASVTSASTSSGINYFINNSSGRQFLSGNYYSQTGDGTYSAYHFSRLAKYSSIRSLSEIISRTADIQAEVARTFYGKVASIISGSSLKNADGT
ncbi:MAG: hypothetical protein J6V40_04790, partial [Clostridia bacterium]|nr:hypothetical protein [Clostridia bacterium]